MFISFSVRRLYLIRSAMVIIRSLCFLEKSRSFGSLAIVPSSSIISQIVPADFNPASLAKSTAASVWPALFRTPPGIALKGKTCPGLLKSSALVSSETTVLMVSALSLADIPVVILPFAPMLIVKAVPSLEVLDSVMSSIMSSSSLSLSHGIHIRPRPFLDIKLIASAVTFSAAITRSPSFSLSASSTTITIRPDFMSSNAFSMLENLIIISYLLLCWELDFLLILR